MIFTPEESREIAEGMFGWKFFPAKRALVVGEYSEESQETPAYWKSERRSFLSLPDFSLPEWTGPILEKVLTHGDEYNTIAFSPGGAVWWTHRGQNVLVFDYGNINVNLFHLWKWLREQKEATNVRPE